MMNIFLISIDDLRFDCVSYNEEAIYLEKYGVQKKEVRTPFLDSLCYNGLYFKNAFTTAPYTPPAHASVFTGLFPLNHGLLSFIFSKLREVTTLQKWAKSKGYFIIHGFTSQRFKEAFDGFNLNKEADEIVIGLDKLILKLAENIEKKIFLFLHISDIHLPYLYCEEDNFLRNDNLLNLYLKKWFKIIGKKDNVDFYLIEEKWQTLMKELWLRGYKEEVVRTYIMGVNLFDFKFGQFFDILGKMGYCDDTIFIIFSDHGDCGYDSSFFHSWETLPYEELIRVFLVIYAPHLFQKGQVIEGLTSLVDLFPILLEIFGESIKCDGLNTLSEKRNYIIVEEWYQGEDALSPLFAIRNENYKYIMKTWIKEFSDDAIIWLITNALCSDRTKLEENYWRNQINKNFIKEEEIVELFVRKGKNERHCLFDLKKDPLERVNLINKKEYFEIAKSMQNELLNYLNTANKEGLLVKNETEQLKEKLKMLGYF